MENDILIWACMLSAVFGLCVGRFLNVVIYRLPRGMRLTKPSVHCPFCHYTLRWYDNIPILSYITLGGRCRNCKARISVRYLAVEFSNAALWVLCVLLLWGKSIPLSCVAMAVMSVFLCIFFIDLEHKIIFDRFQIFLLILGALSAFFDTDFGWRSHLIGGIVGFAFFFAVASGFEALCGREGLGGGDIKLAGVAGLLLGWERLLLGLLIATVSASVIMGIFSNGRDGESREFPFAPFLVSGFGISMLFGSQTIHWYLSLFGL